MNPYLLRSSVFTSFLSTIICSIFYLARYGLSNNFNMGFNILGLTLLVLNAPSTLDYLLKKGSYVFPINNLLHGVIIVAALSLLGWWGLGLLASVTVWTGYLCFAVVFVLFLSSLRINDLVSVLVIVVFSIWVSSVVWGGGFLNPIFIEKLILGNFNDVSATGLDPLFHMSYAQMIKTYGVSSTGLNGIPVMNYHFGSHILFAALSKFLSVNVFYFYNLCYPVLFIPLFFKFFFDSIYYLRSYLLKSVPSFNYAFWFVFLVGFVGLFETTSKGFTVKAGTYWNSVIISESYLVSLIFLLAFLITIIDLKGNSERSVIWERINLYIFFPLLIVFIGFCKISTLFILLTALGYIYLRLKLYRFKKFNISLILNILAVISSYLFTYDNSYSNTRFEILAFYWNYIHIKFIVFILVYFFWSILFIVINIYNLENKLTFRSVRDNVVARKYILPELILVISVVGFLPGFFLKIPGGSASYFSEIQNWLALILVMSSLPVIRKLVIEKLAKYSFKRIYTVSALIIFLGFALIGFSKNILRAVEVALQTNLTPRAWYSNYKNDPVFEIEGAIAKGNFKRISTILDSIGRPVQDNLDHKSEYLTINKLLTLDSLPVEEKKKAFLFVKDYYVINNLLPCFKIPYLIPAISGIAGYGNYSHSICPKGDYGMEYYSNAVVQNYNDLCNHAPKSILYVADFQKGEIVQTMCTK